jgi:2'-5' RNA ligase
MAFLGTRLPHETARLLWQLDYGDYGGKEPIDHAHITLMYFGDEVPVDVLTACIQPLLDIAEATMPFTAHTRQVSTFPSDKKVPIICLVESLGLHQLRDRIWSEFDRLGIPYDKKFPEFKPHITLAYTEDHSAHGKVNLEFPEVTWGVHEMVLWAGEEGDDRLTMTFPFSIMGKNAAATKVYLRHALATRSR